MEREAVGRAFRERYGRAARIFRANDDVLSLTSHGAYHLHAELVAESSGRVASQLFEDAAAR